ncbi:hypothetical protein GZ77_17695 [Endozoicomonas montiporae]|uniref:Uncharacterized protein n=2 Tax=Endozoicomonas montiporae TaxID=1027273 RepID=A0A081N1Q2_9GAMM|nr:hypothetical protein [Endozoicomonas montiporae]AMO58687.1 hypothetical protein EZMO1_4786 [Endozoicomonas montiporae CL-33]KEQ12375.1 hypothetical protein GZ77_17695 [Endozoicomonas montiporae]
MINKALYDSLVELGINVTQAEEAARQDVALAELRQMIYELTRQTTHVSEQLVDFKAATNARFDRIDDRLDKMDDRFNKMNDRFDKLEDKIDQLLNR